MIYNPALLKKEDLIRGFVARRALLDRLVEDIRRAEVGSPQHHLILGQRGLGKTTLLRRLGHAVEDDPRLSAIWQPVVFPEEQYNIAGLGDFWLNCADALGDALDRKGDEAAAAELDARVASVAGRPAAGLQLLLEEADRLQRRLLLLVDNLDIVLDRIGRDEEWEFRRIISSERRLLIVGASSRALEAVYDHGRAFYDFFQTHELKGLDDDETFQVLRDLAIQAGNEQVQKLLEQQPGRIRTLRLLTGGNPRTLILLFRVLAQESGGSVEGDIEQLLDLYTPLYKARFEELPEQAQRVVDAMALHWDPLTAAMLADRVRLPVNQTSAQLHKLEDMGVVEKTDWHGEKKTAFQIAERFFNIWYLMRASRRLRRQLIWLVRFLESWFSPEELRTHARDYLHRDPDTMGRERYAAMSFALSERVDDGRLRSSLEHAALRAAVEDERVRKMFDFADLGPELRDKKARMEKMAGLRNTVLRARTEWDGVEPAEFWRLLGGSPHYSVGEKERIVEGLGGLTAADFRALCAKLRHDERRLLVLYQRESAVACLLYEALAGGEMADAYDWESALAVADIRGLKGLPSIAIGSLISPYVHPGALAPPELERAEAALRAMAEEPDLAARAWNGLGNLLRNHLKRYDEAEQAYRKAIEVDQQLASPWNNLGNLLQDHLKRYDEAEQAYRKAIDLDPQFAYPWNGLGDLLQDHLKRYDEAEQAYRKAIEVDPQLAYPRSNLGRLLEQTAGREREAAQARLEAYRLDRTRSWDLSSAADSIGKMAQSPSQRSDAEALARRACELAPDDTGSAFTLAAILMANGRWQEARPILSRLAKDEDATHPPVPIFQAITESGHAGEAAQLLKETGGDQRWRPLYEALQAAAVKDRKYLNRVAQEVRVAAEQILRRIAGDLFR